MRMGERLEVVRNTRKAHCGTCHKLVLPGEGIQHLMPWFHGRNPVYYLCETCNEKEKAERKPGDLDLTVFKSSGAGGSPTGKKMR